MTIQAGEKRKEKREKKKRKIRCKKVTTMHLF
jgi:hypothetical protein